MIEQERKIAEKYANFKGFKLNSNKGDLNGKFWITKKGGCNQNANKIKKTIDNGIYFFQPGINFS